MSFLRELRGARLLIAVAAVVLLLLVVSRALTAIHVDALWFAEVGHEGVFWRQFAWIWGVRGLTALLVTGALFFNLQLVGRTLGSLRIRRRFGNLEIAERVPPHHVTTTILALSLLLGLWFGASITEGAARSLLFWNVAPSWGVTDPILGLDLGFYVFALPVLRAVVTFALVVTFLVLTICTAGYATTGVVRLDEGAVMMSEVARRHLGLLVALFLVLLAARLGLGRPLLLLSGGSDVQGVVGYTDVMARIPALRIQALVTLGGAVAIAMGAWKNRFLPVMAGAASIVAVILLVGQLYPALVQRFRVVPNEFDREAAYITHHLDFTRRGFGLDSMARARFEARPGGEVDWAGAMEQFGGLPVWSRSALLTAFRQVEARFRYYDFNGVVIDRYPTDEGEVAPVAVSVREVDPNQIEDPNWQNLHLRERYLVGNGIVAVDATGRTIEGRPRNWLAGIPPFRQNDAPPGLRIDRSEIYVGTRVQPYALVTPTDSAFLAPDGGPGVAGVDFPPGIAVGGPLRRAILAWYLREANLLFSAGVVPESRLVLRRGVAERAARIAPFLLFPEEPYPVLHEGRVVWVLEAMTATRFFPLARPFDTPGVSWVRNSVKVTVDAVTGAIDFYAVPTHDPLRDAYAAAFPGLFKPLDEMPAGLRAHLRYSRSLMAIQARVLLDYHQESPAIFFGRQDVWASPQELAEGATAVPYQPEYGILRLPGDDEPDFHLVTTFVPAGRQNLTGILAGRLDEAGTPRLRLFDVPVENQVAGPRQVEALVEQDPEISQQFSLWRSGGSRVWTGHLHLVPVEDRVVYMEPVFLAAEEDAIPELRRYVVSDGQAVVMAETLEGAVAILSGDDSFGQVEGDDAPSDLPDAGLSPVAPERALEWLDRAEERLRQGDWAGFGEALERLRRLLGGGPSG